MCKVLTKALYSCHEISKQWEESRAKSKRDQWHVRKESNPRREILTYSVNF